MFANPSSQAGVTNPRVLLALAFCSVGVLLAGLSVLAAPHANTHSAKSPAGNTVSAPTVNGWSLVPSANINEAQQRNGLQSVYCISASDCWAVGYAPYAATGRPTLIEHWNGSTWVIVPSPEIGYGTLYAVQCVTASNCWAVGYNSYGALIEHWDGMTWSIVTAHDTLQAGTLLAIACTSATDCWAAGYYYDLSNYQHTFVEHWNGSSWAVVNSPNLSMTEAHELTGVDCTSASDCWAVGNRYNTAATRNETLVEHWNGSAWSVVTSPNFGMGQYNILNAISCVSASDCWAAGNVVSEATGNYETLTLHWDGVAWSRVPSPNGAGFGGNELLGVTCTSTQDCWAVGHSTGMNMPLILHWDGMQWTLVFPPGNSALYDSELLAVSCPASSSCVAVGNQRFQSSPYEQTLAEHWDGNSWAFVATANVNHGPQTNVLSDVTCVSDSDCWAVGYHNYSNNLTLVEHWDGMQWSVVGSPNSGNTSSSLSGVTCNSQSDCWAVGYYYSGGYPQTLIEHWNGVEWSITPSPNASAGSNSLVSVTCASPIDCWAVGGWAAFGFGPRTQTLTVHWNGVSWTILPSPNVGTQDTYIRSVSCASGDDCWAVGSYNSGFANQTLIERWNGVLWTIASSPNNGISTNVLNSVSCLSSQDCWTVGYYQDVPLNRAQTLVQHWNGASWQIVPSPNSSPTQFNVLNGIDCVSASECWAVGYHDSTYTVTLIERWNGSSWSVVASPNVTTEDSQHLNAVGCASATDCWAVGYWGGGSEQQTVIERFTTEAPALTSVVSRKTHGGIGPFDINLPATGNPGIESRSGGVNGDYQTIFTFGGNVTTVNSTVSSSGSVSSALIGPNPNQYTVNLTSVPNAQYVSVTLNDVQDSAGNIGTVSSIMGVLVGDSNGNGAVNASDVAQTKAQVGQPITSGNFRSDVNANGTVNASDVAIVKSQVGTSLP